MIERKPFKKILILLLVLLTAIAFSACGDEEAHTESENEQAEEVQNEPVKKPEAPETVLPEGEGPFYLRVNCTTNTVMIYTQDENGDFTVPDSVMLCSTGLDSEGMSTPKGVYNLTGNRWEWLEMVDGTYGIYVTQFSGDFLFHSVPYTEYGNHGSLKPGEYDKLGTDASHGCVRLCIRDAKWIYDNMYNIYAVEIIDDANPGPFGKPEKPDLDGSDYPGWDPTDEHPDNPWNR